MGCLIWSKQLVVIIILEHNILSRWKVISKVEKNKDTTYLNCFCYKRIFSYFLYTNKTLCSLTLLNFTKPINKGTNGFNVHLSFYHIFNQLLVLIQNIDIRFEVNKDNCILQCTQVVSCIHCREREFSLETIFTLKQLPTYGS